MSEPSIQLDLETALKNYITGISLFDPSVPIYAGHSTEFAQKGTYVAINANPPDWYALGGQNPVLEVQFQFATEVVDPDARAEADTEHATRTGALIDLLSQQRFKEVLIALNPPVFPFPDNRPWKGLGFDAWEQNPGEDTRTDTQVLTTLLYEFVVHLES
jgi:hypothetical protein